MEGSGGGEGVREVMRRDGEKGSGFSYYPTSLHLWTRTGINW